MKLRLFAPALALGLLTAAAPLRAATVTTLPTSNVVAISNSGAIAGQGLDLNGHSWAAIGSGASWKALKAAGFDSTMATCTNGVWTGGGAFTYDQFTEIPVIWNSSGVATVLGNMPGEVTGICGDRVAVTFFDLNEYSWPYVYSIGQKQLTPLTIPSGYTNGWTASMSTSGPGMIAGTLYGSDGTVQGVFWNGGLQPKVTGTFPSGTESWGVGVNSNAQFIGTYNTLNGGGSYYWDSINGQKDLSRDDGYVNIESINKAGVAVGTEWHKDETQTAVAYSVSVGLIPLGQNDANYNIIDARSINDSGVIVGRAYKVDGPFARPVTVLRVP